MLQRIPLDQIGYDPRHYPRVNGKEDWLTVHRYTDTLLSDAGMDFPPIHVVKATGKPYAYALLDGLHRTRSYGRAERETIPAVVERLPESKWLARSVELNIINGRPMDTGDKAWVAKRLEEDGLEREEVAKLLCMRLDSLEKIMAVRPVKLKAKAVKIIPMGRSNREMADGSHYGFLKAPFADQAGLGSAQQALAVQSPVSSMSVLRVLDSAIAVLECGVDVSDEEVRDRIERIKELLP